MNLFGKLVLKHHTRSFPLAFSKALTRTLHNKNAGKIHSTVAGDLSASLWMNKILLEAVKPQCHVLYSQTTKEESNSSCNKINHQPQLSSWAQILQLHHDVVLLYHHMYVQEQNNNDTESWIHICSNASHLCYTKCMCIQKTLKEIFLQRKKCVWKFTALTDLHVLCSCTNYMVRGSIMSFFLWLSLACCISNHISELLQGLKQFLVQY